MQKHSDPAARPRELSTWTYRALLRGGYSRDGVHLLATRVGYALERGEIRLVKGIGPKRVEEIHAWLNREAGLPASEAQALAEDYFSSRQIEVVGHPPHSVLEKARGIIGRMESGTPYWQLRGKRLQRNRTVISIPVGRDWRIIAHDENGQVRPDQVLSHERYNQRLSAKSGIWQKG